MSPPRVAARWATARSRPPSRAAAAPASGTVGHVTLTSRIGAGHGDFVLFALTPPRRSTDAERLPEIAAATMERLRAPGGCAWDRDQTHASLVQYLVEESAELVEAIEAGDDAEMVEELGDVLYQVLFHADIAAEEGRFTLEDVAAHMTQKMFSGAKYCGELNGTRFYLRHGDRVVNLEGYLSSLESRVKAGSYNAAKRRAWTVEDAKQREEEAKKQAQEDKRMCEQILSVPKLEKRLQELQAAAKKE